MPRILMYLLLSAVGFYFGRYVGSLGLVMIYYFWSRNRLLDSSHKKSSSPLTNNDNKKLHAAYKELGVTETADEQTIKMARKKLLNHFHPDKLDAASETEKSAADEKVVKINRAYQYIQQHRGF